MYTIYLFFGSPPPLPQTGTNLQAQLIGGLSEAQKLIGLSDDLVCTFTLLFWLLFFILMIF